jgi:hypothetical protein
MAETDVSVIFFDPRLNRTPSMSDVWAGLAQSLLCLATDSGERGSIPGRGKGFFL